MALPRSSTRSAPHLRPQRIVSLSNQDVEEAISTYHTGLAGGKDVVRRLQRVDELPAVARIRRADAMWTAADAGPGPSAALEAAAGMSAAPGNLRTTVGAVPIGIDTDADHSTGSEAAQTIIIPDLTVHEGDLVLLDGPSGIGKSTLALALAGEHTGDVDVTASGRVS